MRERMGLYQLPTQTTADDVLCNNNEDESCIVIDGGNTGDGNYLLNFLKKTGKEKPEIDAWFFSIPFRHVNHL